MILKILLLKFLITLCSRISSIQATLPSSKPDPWIIILNKNSLGLE